MGFGACVERTNRSAEFGGVEVVRVIKGTPAESVINLADGNTYSLPPGSHVITQVNGERVRDPDEFDAAVERSPQIMRFTLRSLKSRRTDEYKVELSAANAIRFGVTAEATARSQRVGGVEVVDVVPGYPATRIRNDRDGREYTLMPGVDFITHVNGRPITDDDDLPRAVRASPREMKIRVYDSYHDAHESYLVDLYD